MSAAAGLAPLLDHGAIVQNAYVVPDLEAASRALNRLYGIGPVLTGARGVLDNHVYRGRAAEPILIRGAFVQSGDIVLELIELKSDGPSAFHDMFAKGDTGFHHAAVFVDDYAGCRDALAAAGYPVASEFTVSFGAQVCYVDTRPVLGHMLELYPEHDGIRAMYRRTRAEADGWDGRELFRTW